MLILYEKEKIITDMGGRGGFGRFGFGFRWLLHI